MVLEVTLFFTRSSSALVIFNVMVLPLMAHVPRIVPVTPWESVLLMKPWRRNWAMKLPSPLKVIDSFMLPTVSRQLPTIFALYSASATGSARRAGRDAQGQGQEQAEPHKVEVMFHGNLFLSGVVDSRDKLKRDVSSSLIDLLLKNDTIRSIASTIDAPRQTLSTNEPRLGRPIMQFHCSGDSGLEVSEALPVLWQRTIRTTGPFQPLQCDLTSITVIARDSFEFKKHCHLSSALTMNLFPSLAVRVCCEKHATSRINLR